MIRIVKKKNHSAAELTRILATNSTNPFTLLVVYHSAAELLLFFSLEREPPRIAQLVWRQLYANLLRYLWRSHLSRSYPPPMRFWDEPPFRASSSAAAVLGSENREKRNKNADPSPIRRSGEFEYAGLNRVISNIRRSRAFSIRSNFAPTGGGSILARTPINNPVKLARLSLRRKSRRLRRERDETVVLGPGCRALPGGGSLRSSAAKIPREDSARLLVSRSVATITAPAARKRCALSFVEPSVRENRSSVLCARVRVCARVRARPVRQMERKKI